MCRHAPFCLVQHLARVLLALAHDGVKPVPLQPQLLPARVVAGDAKKTYPQIDHVGLAAGECVVAQTVSKRCTVSGNCETIRISSTA